MPAAPMTSGAAAAGLKIDLATRKAMRAQAGLMQGVNQVPSLTRHAVRQVCFQGLPPSAEPRAVVCRAA